MLFDSDPKCIYWYQLTYPKDSIIEFIDILTHLTKSERNCVVKEHIRNHKYAIFTSGEYYARGLRDKSVQKTRNRVSKYWRTLGYNEGGLGKFI